MNRPKILGISDPLTAPTGFGRVARELFTRLAETGKYDLGYLSHGWPGSSRFPGVVCYSDDRSNHCQEAFPRVALDFAQNDTYLLWTLMDPWQVGWLALPHTSPLRHPRTTQFLKEQRRQMHWVGHFPIDGEGTRNGRPARWTEEFIEPMDTPVAMSEWGRRVTQEVVKKDVRFISHAVNDTFRPMPKAEARLEVERRFAAGIARGLAKLPDADRPPTPQAFADELEIRKFKIGERFTVLCVMANRERKYWWDVLRAFRQLVDVVPDARLIGVCGHRAPLNPDAWPLEECVKELGLRLDFEADDPNVWLIETVVASHLPEDESMRILYNAADCSILISGGEGFGLPQLEAHACGIPCVAGDYSASSELAVHHRELIGPRGFTYTTNNMVRRPIYSPKDIADRLAWVAKNPAWRQEVGAAGVAQAQERTWQKILPQWIDLFDECFAKLEADHGSVGRPAEAATA